MAFGVADLTAAIANLSHRGIEFSGSPSEGPIGHVARFTDPAGRVLWSNRALRDMLGYAEEELRGMFRTEFTLSEDVGEDARLYEELLRGERAARSGVGSRSFASATKPTYF